MNDCDFECLIFIHYVIYSHAHKKNRIISFFFLFIFLCQESNNSKHNFDFTEKNNNCFDEFYASKQNCLILYLLAMIKHKRVSEQSKYLCVNINIYFNNIEIEMIVVVLAQLHGCTLYEYASRGLSQIIVVQKYKLIIFRVYLKEKRNKYTLNLKSISKVFKQNKNA